MNRITIALAAALLLLASTACLAIFPAPDLDGITTPLRQGWFDNTQAWYMTNGISTNDIGFANNFRAAWLSPKLSSLLQPKELGGEIAARPMYIVRNPLATQGYVFSAAPGQDPPDMLYSGFWQVFYIFWKPGATRRPIINATPGDPQGLPDASEADIIATSVVIQLPIVAVGPLGGPWLPAPPGSYRIKQAMADSNYTRTKFILMPGYFVFCREIVRRLNSTDFAQIPDASDPALADLLGANWAPGLLNVPDGTIDPAENDTQALYWIPNSPWRCQYPIRETCPSGIGRSQRNPDFTPVTRLIELDRNIPYWTVVNNAEYVEHLLSSGGLLLINDDRRMGLIFPVGG